MVREYFFIFFGWRYCALSSILFYLQNASSYSRRNDCIEISKNTMYISRKINEEAFISLCRLFANLTIDASPLKLLRVNNHTSSRVHNNTYKRQTDPIPNSKLFKAPSLSLSHANSRLVWNISPSRTIMLSRRDGGDALESRKTRRAKTVKSGVATSPVRINARAAALSLSCLYILSLNIRFGGVYLGPIVGGDADSLEFTELCVN